MTNFKTVSLQGIQLTSRQKYFEEQRARAVSKRPKIDLVTGALKNLEQHKGQGGNAFKPWQLDFVKTGTSYLGDAFIH